MKSSDIVYWGDCDEAGYGILSMLRSSFPHVRSLLMDDATWRSYEHLALSGRSDPSSSHKNLTADELAARAEVIAGPWMLEQERIPMSVVEAALGSAFS